MKLLDDWKNWRKKRRLKTVEKTIDEAALKKIALNDSDWSVRKAAVKKITDKVFLKKIVSKDSNWSVCCAAEKRLENINS